MLEKRGISKKTLKKYGIIEDKDRVIIPIKSSSGEVLYNKYWYPNKDPKYVLDKGAWTYLFPIEQLYNNNDIILCEGEFDALLLIDKGFNAVTVTTGANSWDDTYNNLFVDKKVKIIYDCDKTGKINAVKVANKLINIAKEIKIIDLGLKDKEDISDWFLKYNKTTKELKKLIDKTEVYDIYEKIPLAIGMESKYYNKKIKFDAIVIGKNLSPYIIPKKIEAVCNYTGSSNKCVLCPLSNNEKFEMSFNEYDDIEFLLKCISANDLQITGFIKQKIGIPPRCPGNYKINIIERQTVEEIQIIPPIISEAINYEYVVRKAYCFSNNIKTNNYYLLKGTTQVEPTTQMGIHIIHKAISSDLLNEYKFTKDMKEKLDIFKVEKEGEDGIMEKLEDIYNDISHNVTKIYGRNDMLTLIDLVYHSVLYFRFRGKKYKGWAEGVIMGDTKSGKTETIQNLAKFYKAGEFITSGENTTRAGILGGAQQLAGGRWMITWGKIPLNDRKLVCLDEADKLGNEVVDLLSGVRSSGLAELIVITPQKTMARTRLLWIFNPKYGNISEYNYGIEVIKEVFKKPQDISRIDLVLAVSNTDVDLSKHFEEDKKVEHKYTSELCHNLIMYAWSRGIDNIIIPKETENEILKYSKILSSMFTPDIPLFVEAEGHIKLARLSIALATRLFSTDESGENIIVKPEHVRFVAYYINKIYSSEVSGFADFSKQRESEKKIGDTDFINEYIKGDVKIINLLLDLDTYRVSDIEDIFGVDRKTAKQLISNMITNRLIKRYNTIYKKTNGFIRYLKRYKEDLKKEPPF